MPAPRSRSTSTGSSATPISASRRSWANCTWSCSPSRIVTAAATRWRSTCASGWRALTLPEGAALKVVEVPPGPPVLATLLAEIYGPDATTRRAVAQEVKTLFRSVPFIVDVDDSFGQPRPRLRIAIDQDRARISSASSRAMCTTRSAHCSAASPSAIPIAARNAYPIEIRGRAADAATSAGTSASRRRRCRRTRCRATEHRRARRGGAGRARGRVARAVPPRRAFRRHGDGRARRPVRGADLRHDRGAAGDRGA